MAVPEYGQEFLICDLRWIVVNLDRLRMTVEVVVCGVIDASTSVTDAGADYSVNTPEPGVRSPESAQGEGSGFSCHRRGGIYRRYSDVRNTPIIC